MKSYPVIETERLILRGPKQSDLQAIYDVHTDPDVMRYYGVPLYDSLDKAQRDFDWMNKLVAEKTGFRPVITLKDDDVYIGDVGFDNYVKKSNRMELGYILAKKHWGKGLMTEAIRAVLEYGFMEMELNRVQALVDPRNVGSRRVLEKNGFKYEGTLREYEFEIDGYVDLEMYSILKREFS